MFADAGASITPGDGCTAMADGSVVCRVDGLAGVRVLLGDGDDRLDASALRDQGPPPSGAASNFYAVEVDGGDGAEALLGADATFSCLRGNDVITSAVTRQAPERALCGPIGGHGADKLVGGEADDVLSGGPGVDSIVAGRGRDQATGGSDDDQIDLGAGRDSGGGGKGDDRILGGAGKDSLTDSEGADALSGEGGDDTFALDFRTAGGADELLGGPGQDTAKFLCPSCHVSLNGTGDDGPAGGDASDDVVQIERVVTTSARYDATTEGLVSVGLGDDVLTGNRFANLLDGNAGPDLISGGGGPDRLVGGPGSDHLRAGDGHRDEVKCGGGHDRALADQLHRVTGCERVRIAPS